jgi:hypothetical protein
MDCFLIGALVSTAVAIHPIELDDVISNPGMGWQSFYTTKNNDPNNAGIPSQAAYIRYCWSTLEPTRGNFNFDALRRDLAAARASGQKMMIRVMSYGHDGSGPAWLRNLGAHGHWFSFEGGPMQWAPDPEDPVVQAEHFRLLRALGRRYDGDPDVDAIDIGSIGLWGEWHNWHTSPVVPMPSTATAHRYIDQYFNDFPTTPKIGPVGVTDYPQGAENPGDYAVSRGAGWRGDSLGDPSNMAMYPSHVNDFLTAAGATDVWKNAWKAAPVAFEMSGDLRKWTGSIARIVDYALANHASYVNNKSTPIPAGARPEIERLLKKLGYRLVLRGLEHPAAVTAGQPLALAMDWENVGVAPSYRNDVLAVQLRDASGSPVLTADTGIVVKAWLPGSIYHATPTVTLPAGLAPGTYTLAIGVVDPATRKPVVQLAIQGRDANGWYPLSTVSVNP